MQPIRPLTPIIAEPPTGDRRPTVIRAGIRDRDGIFRGWGPKL